MKLRLNHSALTAIAQFASNDETRLVICGVLIKLIRHQSGIASVIMAATDGRAIALLRDPESSATECSKADTELSIIIPVEVIKRWKTLQMLDRDGIVTVEVIPGLDANDAPKLRAFLYGLLSLRWLPVEMVTQCVPGKFPAWKEIIPKGELVYPQNVFFRPELLGKFAKVAEYLEKGSGILIRAFKDPKQDLGTHYVGIAGNPNFAGFVMPMRTSASDAPNISLPGWL